MHLTLHLTTACSMACTYCYAPPRPGHRMSEAVGRAAVDFGARLNPVNCGIIFFGGEPLLEKPLIRQLVAYARSLQERGLSIFHFKVTTNGLALDEEFLEFAAEENIVIAVSIDGVREAHDAHRVLGDGSPTFDVVQKKLRMLLDARPYSSVFMVVNPDTVRYFSQSVEFLLDLGCRYMIVSLNYAAEWTEDDLRLLEKEYSRLGRQYVKWTEAGRKFYLSPFEVKISSHIKGEDYRRDRCELGARQFSVDTAGYVYPCIQFPAAGPESRFCIGSVFDGVDEDRLRSLHDEAEAPKDPCRDCAIRDRCNHTCACLNWQTTGTITRVSPVLCRHERIITPIADGVAETLYGKRNALFIHKHYNDAYPLLSLLQDTIA
ncbi:MAG: radical SAM protein [Planctomycetes bacterium]|nr:radical SAM protein [Planctomycetota bacterium]